MKISNGTKDNDRCTIYNESKDAKNANKVNVQYNKYTENRSTNKKIELVSNFLLSIVCVSCYC